MLSNMLETSEQRQLRLWKHTPEDIEREAIKSMRMILTEDEVWVFRGGVCNRILKQIKSENGTIYEKIEPDGLWQEVDVFYIYNSFLDSFKNRESVIRKKWYEFWK